MKDKEYHVANFATFVSNNGSKSNFMLARLRSVKKP